MAIKQYEVATSHVVHRKSIVSVNVDDDMSEVDIASALFDAYTLEGNYEDEEEVYEELEDLTILDEVQQ